MTKSFRAFHLCCMTRRKKSNILYPIIYFWPILEILDLHELQISLTTALVLPSTEWDYKKKIMHD